MEAISYMLEHPELRPEDLVIEVHKSESIVGPDRHVLRVRGGELIAEMAGLKIKVTE